MPWSSRKAATAYVHWETPTARLLPRLLASRTTGPVFLADRRAPASGRRAAAPGDVDPTTRRGRLSYPRAEYLFKQASIAHDPHGAGYTLHQLRHSGLTHLAAKGRTAPELQAKSRHRHLGTLGRYVQLGEEISARITAETTNTAGDAEPYYHQDQRFGGLGQLPKRRAKQDEVPEVVIDHVRRRLNLDADVSPAYGSDRTAQDVASLGDYDPVKQVALLACLVYTAQARARDDLAEMLCKRVAVITQKAKTELDEIRLRQRAVTERLIGGYKTVLEQLTPEGAATATEQAALRLAHEALVTAAGDVPVLGLAIQHGEAMVGLVQALKVQAEGLGAIRAQVEGAGGLAEQLADIEEVSAYHGDNHEMLIQRHFRKDRAIMLELAGRLEFEATSADRSVLAALEHAVAHWTLTRGYIPDHVVSIDPATGEEVVTPIDTSFASGNWQKVIRDRSRPGALVRRHFKACVFTYLAEELRTGA
ncbi:MAG: hypothetical protein ACRDTH_26870 [Pseudonocardiaceae bacterium]